MKKMNLEEMRQANGGGRTYKCPFCNYAGSYWKVYGHALGCSYKNSKLYRYGWTAAIGLIKAGIRLIP